MDDDERPLVLAGRQWPSFLARTIVIAPDSLLPFDESQWQDALVVVESGVLELVTTTGYRRSFQSGDLLWLTGLPLLHLHNAGCEPVVLKALSRRPAAVDDPSRHISDPAGPGSEGG